MKYLPLIGRILFALIFLTSGIGHFSQPMVDYAEAHGVPIARALVPFAGIIAIVGALSIMLGYKAKWGAGLLVLFLVPVTIMMHGFWAVIDPAMAQIEQAMFMKNISMLGAALLIVYFGSGPLSLDERLGSGYAQRRYNVKQDFTEKKKEFVQESP